MLFAIKGNLYNIYKEGANMGMLLNVQVSIFSNYHIEASPANISYLMQKINDLGEYVFLPNIVTGQNIDLVAGKVNTTSNLSFITSDKQGQILCMDDRIDCILNFNADKHGDLEKSIGFCESIIVMLMTEFSITANRLAVNINNVSNTFSAKLIETCFGTNFVSTLDYYKGKVLSEWSTRYNTHVEVEVGEKTETINVITELSEVNRVDLNEKVLLCHLDINTIPENNGYRFTKVDITDFVSETKKIIKHITSNFEEVDNCE